MDSNNDNEPPEPTLDGELPDDDEFYEDELPEWTPDEDDDRSLPVQRNGDELVITVSEDAIDAINDVADERDERAEITFLSALRKVIRHAQADWFDERRAIDEEPVEPPEIDEEALAEELNELEEELAEEREDTIDKEALADELSDIEENLPASIRDDLSDDKLRELITGIQREKQAFEAAMELDTEDLIQDSEE